MQDRDHRRPPGRIRAAGGSLAGDKYTIAGKGTSCSSARTRVTKFTHQQDTIPIKGPAGFTCRSFSTAASGDKLLDSGACMHPPHNIPSSNGRPKSRDLKPTASPAGHDPQHKRAGMRTYSRPVMKRGN